MASDRTRIDERLVELGLVASRSQAQRLVMAGSVRADGQTVHKSSTLVGRGQEVAVDQGPPFVSRGGEKLANALDDLAETIAGRGWHIDGAHAIDIGASTGGFTDCLLQRGAADVIAVDVGYGQLDQRLREDPRVIVMERTNARHLETSMLPRAPALLVCDASFIGLATLLPGPLACMAPSWWGVVLIKPQFEAGRERMSKNGRKGVLTDEGVRGQVVAETVAAIEALGVEAVELVQARPPGPKGNIEFALLVADVR